MFGSDAVVPWPRGWVESKAFGSQVFSSDPNDHYREWLEQHVGKQGWDWEWEIANGHFPASNGLRVMFKKGNEHWALVFLLSTAVLSSTPH